MTRLDKLEKKMVSKKSIISKKANKFLKNKK